MRYLLIPIIVLLCFLTADARMNISTYNISHEWGCLENDYYFAYNGDYTSDTDKGCFANSWVIDDGTETGTITVNATYVEINAVNESLNFALGTNDGWNSSIANEGTLWATVELNGSGDPTMPVHFLEISASSTDVVSMYINADGGTDYFYCRSSADSKTHTTITHTTTDPPFGTSYRVGCSWDVANDDFDVSAVTPPSSSTSWNNDGDDLGAIQSTTPTLYIGEANGNLGVNETIRISDVALMPGYRAADPFYP